MFIYICTPYLFDEIDPVKRKSIIDENIKYANDIGLAIAKKGHSPFVPHTMMRGWNDNNEILHEQISQICYKWLEKCDAIYITMQSESIESERKLAVKLCLPIYRNLDDIPDVTMNLSSKLSPEAIQGYLTEYQECMESYRHTYESIWQAGALFAAISAATVAFTTNSNPASGTLGIAPWVQILTPIPVLFWYLGIFRPMNRYGELRNDRLVAIEQLLGKAIPDLQMHHFRDYSFARKGKKGIQRLVTFKWLWRPRVSEIVSIFGNALLLLEIYLIWHYYF